MIDALADWLAQHSRVLVLTGAGLSEPSGIPVYRDRHGNWLRTNPIQHQDFVRSAAARQRYWARSMAGWPRMAQASPNEGHLALAAMERAGLVQTLITQNVDDLHRRAGHQALIELHGSLARVLCLHCAANLSRKEVQAWLRENNPSVNAQAAQMRPDGDADLADEVIAAISVPECPHCGGVLMPDVVFFGGTIPRERSGAVRQAIEACEAVLVVGSSLKVFSGFRICRDAHRMGKPVASLNIGLTRADELFTLKVEMDCAEGLVQLRDRLSLAAEPGTAAAPAS